MPQKKVSKHGCGLGENPCGNQQFTVQISSQSVAGGITRVRDPQSNSVSFVLICGFLVQSCGLLTIICTNLSPLVNRCLTPGLWLTQLKAYFQVRKSVKLCVTKSKGASWKDWQRGQTLVRTCLCTAGSPHIDKRSAAEPHPVPQSGFVRFQASNSTPLVLTDFLGRKAG